MSRQGRLAPMATALAAIALAGAGCADFNLLTTQDEVRLGMGIAREVERKAKLCTDPVVCSYVQEIGARLARVCDRQDVTYTFKVVDDPETVNAFSLPGGFIYVYTGLLLAADNEAELASVIGHEIGHVVARHSAEHLSNRIGMSILLSLVLGENPGVLVELGSQVVTGVGFARMSQRDEFEADQLGILYLKRAGYSPAAAVEFLRKLKKLGGHRSALAQLFATHPLTDERIARANALALQLGIEGRIGAGTYNLRLAALKTRYPSPLEKKPEKSAVAPGAGPLAAALVVAATKPGKEKTMRCRNLTKGNVLVERLEVADTPRARRRGLLGRASLRPGEGLLLTPCRSIHTIGMKFPIDVAFLDGQMKVVALVKNLRPGVMHKTCLRARATLELPAGAIEARRLEIGDRLKVEPATTDQTPR